MHFIGERERHSKVYLPNVQSITLNKDQEHQQVNQQKVIEPKQILERKNIDKIMQNIIKERMFGNFLNQDTKVSAENYYNIDIIGKQMTHRKSRTRSTLDYSHYKQSNSVQLVQRKRKSCSKNKYLTIDISRTNPYYMEEMKKQAVKRRAFTIKLPSIIDAMVENSSPIKKKLERSHSKKLDINEKIAGEKFKKWIGGLPINTTIYDIKMSREIIINNTKHLVDPFILERFFHFFSFPQTFGLRHFCNLVQNAINCSLKFIYFWVFGLFDQNCNGILQSQDLFRFLQKFKIENYYIEQEVYQIQRYLMEIQNNFKPKQQRQLVQQALIVNHNLRLDQLKDLLKQSEKQRIDVNCVKNTCYHQTVMSLEHDPNERLKQGKIQENELETKRMKAEMQQVKKKLQNTPGLRFRDFYIIFKGNKRPKIFCYFISLLTGQNGSVYQ